MKKSTPLTALCFSFLLLFSCKKVDSPVNNNPVTPTPPSSMYFPGASTTWENVDAGAYNWDKIALNDLYSFLETKNTKGFIILKKGRIVAEKYYGSFTVDSLWYWASAGKTFSAFLIGIAQKDGLININNSSKQYLGAGWSSLTTAQENAITVKHHLSMTTGLDDNVANDDCTNPGCLVLEAAPDTRWAYHNAAYYKVIDMVEQVTGKAYNAYSQEKVYSKIGMIGAWLPSGNGFGKIHYSTPRNMAKFGLLLLNKGVWNGTAVLNDPDYFTAMTTSSQAINPAYGYLTWLNGKASYMLPQSQLSFTGSLTPNAPADMYAALGKNDQKIYVVPSLDLVVVRMGNSSGISAYAVSNFDNELWGKLKAVMKY
jgi:CubicO group peptidase (beta-lactamase class C family)